MDLKGDLTFGSATRVWAGNRESDGSTESVSWARLRGIRVKRQVKRRMARGKRMELILRINIINYRQDKFYFWTKF